MKKLRHEKVAAAAKSLQSCLTLCDPIDCSPPGSSVPGILQARTLEWVAISFSNAWKWKMKVKSLSRVWLKSKIWHGPHRKQFTSSQSPNSTRDRFKMAGTVTVWLDCVFWLNNNQEVNPVLGEHFRKEAVDKCIQFCLVIQSKGFSRAFTGRRQWHPTPVLLPGKSQGQGSLVGCRLWGHTESDMTEVT